MGEIREARFTADFLAVDAIEEGGDSYGGDSVEDGGRHYAVFSGYERPGTDWNGWSCPLFARAEADRLMAILGSIGLVGTYHGDSDSYTVVDPGEDYSESPVEGFDGTDIDVDEEAIRVYPIGSHSWTWDAV